MSGGGTGHMSRLALETALRNQQRKEKIKNFKKSGGVYKNSTIKLEFKKATSEELEVLKIKYLKKLKKEKIKNIIIFLISSLISIPLFIYFSREFISHII